MVFSGNTSLKGASMMITDPTGLERMETVTANVKSVELSNDEHFQEVFVKELNFFMKKLGSECCFPVKKESIIRTFIGQYRPQVHYDLKDFNELMETLESKSEDTMLTVPFCSTVEAENLGAIVTFDASNMPMVKGVQDIDKTYDGIWSYRFDQGRMALLLDFPRVYGGHKKLVLKVSGPMVIVSAVMSMAEFFKKSRKDKAFKAHFIESMAQNIYLWIYKAECAGYHMISLADPAGTLELLGERPLV